MCTSGASGSLFLSGCVSSESLRRDRLRLAVIPKPNSEQQNIPYNIGGLIV